jgi:signal transduction histidine kinase/ligand-binding sensor domain-containing protein
MLLRRFKFCLLWTGFGARANLGEKRHSPAAFPNRLIQWFFAIVVAGATLLADGKENEVHPEKSAYQTKLWTTEDGLPQQQISCLKQTRDGYLWIGTHFGLSRFDGVRFISFDESTNPEIINESVDALAEDTDGTLWIGTDGGLLSYRDRHFERVNIPIQEKQSVRRLCPASRGGLWLWVVGSGVFRLLNGQFSPVWTTTQRGEDDVISIQEGTNGWLNIFTKGKWLTVSPESVEIRTNLIRAPESSAWNAVSVGNTPGTAWIGTKQGMFKIDGDALKPIAEDVLATNNVDLIFQDRAGYVWAGSRNEILGKWDGVNWHTVDVGDSIDKSSGICMEEDVEGTLWVATEGGLVQLRQSSVVVYTKGDGIAHSKIWSVCEGKDGEIWAGTERGLSRIDRSGNISSIPFTGRAAGAPDRCVWPKRGGGVWTAKNNIGLYASVDGNAMPAATAELLHTNQITCLGEGHSGLLYVCTEAGVLGFRQDAPLPWAKPEILFPVRAVRSMVETSDGTLWMGTGGNGLARVRHAEIKYFTQKEGLIGNHVWSILDSKDGTLWLATDKGLSRYQNGSFSSFTHRQGLLEDRINCILADNDGYLWLSGLSGIYRVQLAELNAVRDGRISRVYPFALGTADGLKNAETNGEKQPAGWKAHDGRLWFPTVHGVVAIDPKKFPAHEAPPPVIIEQISADNNVLPFGTHVTETKSANAGGSVIRTLTLNEPIPAGKGHAIEFQYTANSLVDSTRVKFRTRLINVDPDWRPETTERRVSYVSLRPGNYRFQVKACNHHNVWDPEPVELAFSLAPHFWQTKTFYVLSGTAVLAIAAGIQAYRLRWQRRLMKLEQQRALAAERARIARDLHDDLGTALTGLALELDVIGRDPKPELPFIHRLGQTAKRTRDLAERMREVVWSVNPRCDTVSSIASFLEQQIAQFLRADGIKVELDFPEDIPALPIGGDARHELALGVREALTNVVRHAQATKVLLSLAIDKDWLLVTVKDNGVGLQPSGRNGDGLRNMQDRLHSIGGTVEFSSTPGSGTTISFRLPLIKSKSAESL